MQRLRAEVDTLNNAVLKDRQLELSVVFDGTTYISCAIDLGSAEYLGGRHAPALEHSNAVFDALLSLH